MIEQRDLKGNLINTYPTKTAAANCLGLNESSIRRAIKYNRTVMGRFKFNRAGEENKKVLFSPAKILILDIETSPLLSYTWGLWNQDIHLDQIVSNWFMLSWSAKWLGDNELMGGVLSPKEVFNQDDSRIVKNLWELLDEADILVAHAGDKFDIPRINSRFIVHGLMPPSPYKQVDTLKIARNLFGFSSNKLEALARIFGFNGKNHTTMDLWVRCMKGEISALLELSLYNDQDIIVLENVYLKLRPFAKGHPNLDLFVDEEVPTCPHCGSDNLVKVPDKFFYTQAVKYEIYRCDDCRAISRSKKGIKFEYKKLVSPIPR